MLLSTYTRMIMRFIINYSNTLYYLHKSLYFNYLSFMVLAALAQLNQLIIRLAARHGMSTYQYGRLGGFHDLSDQFEFFLPC